jgi:hypothetical protein
MTRFYVGHVRLIWHRVPRWLRGAMLAATLYTISAGSTLLIGSTPLSIPFLSMLSVAMMVASPVLGMSVRALEGDLLIVMAVFAGGVSAVVGALVGARKGGWIIIALFLYSIGTLLYGIYSLLTQPFRLF